MYNTNYKIKTIVFEYETCSVKLVIVKHIIVLFSFLYNIFDLLSPTLNVK